MSPQTALGPTILSTALLGIILACDTSEPSTPPVSVLGCYELTITNWSGPHESPDPPTPVILLDSLGSYLLETGRTLVRPAPLGSNMFFDMAWWSRPTAEELDVVFSAGGYVGVRMNLSWLGPFWSGRAEAFTDVAPSIQATATAMMRPVACP